MRISLKCEAHISLLSSQCWCKCFLWYGDYNRRLNRSPMFTQCEVRSWVISTVIQQFQCSLASLYAHHVTAVSPSAPPRSSIAPLSFSASSHAPLPAPHPLNLLLAPLRLVRDCHRTSCDKQANTHKTRGRARVQRRHACTHTPPAVRACKPQAPTHSFVILPCIDFFHVG